MSDAQGSEWSPVEQLEATRSLLGFGDHEGSKGGAERFHAVSRVLGGHEQRTDLLPRAVLRGMVAPDEEVREAATQACFECLTGAADRSVTDELVSAAMCDYEDYSRAQSALVGMLGEYLRQGHGLWPGQTVRLLLSIREIFRISYAEPFAKECVDCLFEILSGTDEPSSRPLHDLVLRWLHGALNSPLTPPPTDRAIKQRLARTPFHEVQRTLLISVYHCLDEEINPQRLAETLAALKGWCGALEYTEDNYGPGTVEELTLYGRGEAGHAALSEELPRMLEASHHLLPARGDGSSRLVAIAGQPGASPQLRTAALDILALLPTGRTLIDGWARRTAPSFLRDLAGDEDESVFEGVLNFLARQVSGLTRTFQEREGEDEDEDGGARTYRERLSRVARRARLENDEAALETVYALVADWELPTERRRRALACLFDIYPADLANRLSEFAPSHSSDDDLVPDVLRHIADRPTWEMWEFCAHYFEVYGGERPCPFLDRLIRAAASTGHEEMIDALIPYVFDSGKSEVQGQARQALTSTGYGAFCDREAIRRRITALRTELQHAFGEVTRIEGDLSDHFDRRFECQLQVENARLGFETKHLQLREAATRFHSFSTGKRVDLGLIDEKLDELNKKIDHLTRRKCELEARKDDLVRRRNALVAQLDSTIGDARQAEEDADRISRSIEELSRERSSLESSLQARQGQLDRARNSAESVRRTEERNLSQLEGEHDSLRGDYRRCCAEDDSLETEQRRLASRESDLQYDADRLHQELRSLRSTLNSWDPEVDGSPSGIRSDIGGVESALSRVGAAISDTRSEANAVRRRRDRIGRDISSIEDGCSRIRRQVDQAQERVGTAEDRVLSAERALNECAADIRRNRSAMRQRENELTALQNRIAALEELVADLRMRIGEYQRRERQLEEELLPVIRDLEQAKREHEKINAERIRQEQAIRSESDRAEAEAQAMETEAQARRERHAKISQDVRELADDIVALNQDMGTWRGKFEDCNQALNDSTTRYQAVSEACLKMRAERNAEVFTESMMERLRLDLAEMDRLEACWLVSRGTHRYHTEVLWTRVARHGPAGPGRTARRDRE